MLFLKDACNHNDHFPNFECYPYTSHPGITMEISEDIAKKLGVIIGKLSVYNPDITDEKNLDHALSNLKGLWESFFAEKEP